MKLFRRIFNKKDIIKVNLTKSINDITFDNLYLALKAVNKKDHCCVFFSLNTSCSLHQAIVMSNIIQEYKERSNSAPIYTFAGDSCIGSGLLTLLSGNKFIADENTLFGFYDFTLQKTNFSKFVDERKIKIRIYTEGENKLRLNPFTSYKDNDVDWALDLLKQRRSVFLDELIRIKLSSSGKITYLNNDNKEVVVQKGNKDEESKWRKVLDEKLGSTFLFTSEMKSLGLVDSIASTEEVKYNEFPKSRIRLYKPKFSLETGDHLSFSSKDLVSLLKSSLVGSEYFKYANLYKLAKNYGVELTNSSLENLDYADSMIKSSLTNENSNALDSNLERDFVNYLTNSMVKYHE